MPDVTYIEFNGTAHRVDVPLGTSIMRGAVDNNVPGIDADCGGECACATCHVYVDAAWLDKTGLPEPGSQEAAMLSFAAVAQPDFAPLLPDHDARRARRPHRTHAGGTALKPAKSGTEEEPMDAIVNFDPHEDAYSKPLDKIDVSVPELYQDDIYQPYFERLRREDPVHFCEDSRSDRTGR